jgi:hypothetical protein
MSTRAKVCLGQSQVCRMFKNGHGMINRFLQGINEDFPPILESKINLILITLNIYRIEKSKL